MRIAITGATGLIGRALVKELQGRGDDVVAFSRAPATLTRDLPGVHPLPWPVEPGGFPRVDAVVHLAGESVAGRWTDAKKAAIRSSRVEGTRQLVSAIAGSSQRPAALISASAIGYYGHRGEQAVTETAAPGSDFLAEVCVAWEREARQAEQAGLRVAFLRTGVVLDAQGGALAQMLPPFRLGVGGPMGNGQQWFSWIQRDDIVGLYLHLIDNEISGPVNGTAPHPVRQGDFAHKLGAALKRPAVIPTPPFALRLMYGEFAQTLFDSIRVLPEAAQATGYRFQYPDLAPALAAALGTPVPRTAAV